LHEVPGVIVDWLGGRTLLANHAWVAASEGGGVVIAELPVPDDRIHAETIEYVAVLKSVERARLHDGSFTMFELGSSYAPWCVTAALAARRAGHGPIHLSAVEASQATIPRIHEHARLNGLSDAPDVTWQVVHAAISARRGSLYFPRIDPSRDNGAQATSTKSKRDYRAVTFQELSSGHKRVDYVHLDLQGAEEALLQDQPFLDAITTRVSAMLLATQSRLIEGLALRALPSRGWQLLRERPTMYSPNSRTADINGWTTRDGAQFWVNGRFDRS
jgi:FkbM family methyltransferase